MISTSMQDDARKRISTLILDEIGSKLKLRDSLRQKLEAFSDLPVDKVADAILNQFEYILSSDLRELIIHLIQQDIEAERAAAALADSSFAFSKASPQDRHPQTVIVPEVPNDSRSADEPAPAEPAFHRDDARKTIAEPASSIMEHFALKEPFPSRPMDIELRPNDWFYLYGFSYAPDSSGKGVPTKKLQMKGADGEAHIFLLDYGDIRLYMSKLNENDFTPDRLGRPTLVSAKANRYKIGHEKVLNALRGEEVLVSVPFWTAVRGRETVIKRIEDHYVELLRALIDVHDAVDWDVEVFALDGHIISLPVIAQTAAARAQRDTKHPPTKSRDIKTLERLIFKEKSLAQEIHSNLLLHANKAKIDYMIRLDAAFMDDWKSILLARYLVGKEKRKAFCQSIAQMQQDYAEFELMFRMSSPTTKFTFPMS